MKEPSLWILGLRMTRRAKMASSFYLTSCMHRKGLLSTRLLDYLQGERMKSVQSTT